MKPIVRIFKCIKARLLHPHRCCALSKIKSKRKSRDRLLKQFDVSTIKLDGFYTKLLKAFADANGLIHKVSWHTSFNGIAVAVDVCAVVGDQLSAIDVFEYGKTASIGVLSRCSTRLDASIIEELSKDICMSIIGPSKCMKSMKGGGFLAGPYLANRRCVRVDHWQKNSPVSLEAMQIEIDMAGVLTASSKVRLCWDMGSDVTIRDVTRYLLDTNLAPRSHPLGCDRVHNRIVACKSL